MYLLFEHSQIITVVERAGEGSFDMSNKFLLVKESALVPLFQTVGFWSTYLEFILVLKPCGGLEVVGG